MPDFGSSTSNTTTPAQPTESLASYRSSQTFLARMPNPTVHRLRVGTAAAVLAIFFVLIPLLNQLGCVEDYKVNVLGKYLCFAIVALGIDLIWGYTGLLSLCQALFFCMGGYVMAMHLSLPQGGGDVRPEYNNIPQFMFFNNLQQLPLFWRPFASLATTVAVGLLLPALAASVFGFFIFRSRVRGVYFAIITQAVAWGAWLLISRNEMLLGGTNGLTNFNKALSEKHSCIMMLYLLTVAMVVAAYLLCRALVRSRLGRVLIAIRDKETRLYFAGYRPYAFKVFAFAVAAMLAAVGGMLYSPQVTIISPHNMRVEESITMVIWVALGGRGKLWGAIFGSLLVNYAMAALTSDMPTIWLIVQGGMFLFVVLFFPDGFVGLWEMLERQIVARTGWRNAVITVLPLVVLSLFVLGEALGLMPGFLRAAIHCGTVDVQMKYLVLLAAMVTAVVWQWVQKRSAKAPGGRALPAPAAAGRF